MLEVLAPIVTAITTAIAILSVIWIYRRTKRIDSVHFIFGLGVIIFAMYHFYACGLLDIIIPLNGIVTSLFISSVAWVNAYCSTCNTVENVVNIGVCRRNEATAVRKRLNIDRRKTNSHTLFKSVGSKG